MLDDRLAVVVAAGHSKREALASLPASRRHELLAGKKGMIGKLATLAALAVIGFAAASPLRAQSYPSRPIKLIVAVLPGGPMDVMGRLIAQYLSSSFGQVFVENRAGGGTTLGAKAVASAEPDGYTLLLGNSATLAIGPTLYKSAGYDPQTSFVPVAFLASVPYVMILSPALPMRSVQELVAYAKGNPGKLSFGVPNAAPPHLLAARFKLLTATDVVIVPYKGASAVLTDMLGGQIQAGFETTSVLFGHLQEKTIKALAVAATARLPDLPEVPTMLESGFPDFVASSWTSIMAPAGTPREIVEKLNAEINAGLNSPVMQARLKQLGAHPRTGTPEELAAFIASEIVRWRAMIKLTGITGE
jgi:tripartite-type tricarboxylate transporter receptor subunit TctC